MTHPLWEPTVMFMIGLSSAKLAFDANLNDFKQDNIIVTSSNEVDKIFNYIFIVEMVTKLVAQGLIMDEMSYLRDSWS